LKKNGDNTILRGVKSWKRIVVAELEKKIIFFYWRWLKDGGVMKLVLSSGGKIMRTLFNKEVKRNGTLEKTVFVRFEMNIKINQTEIGFDLKIRRTYVY
jgi:hypothetical protein